MTVTSRVVTGGRLSTGAARSGHAAERVSRTSRATLLLESVGEVFNDCVGKEPFEHLSKLRFDIRPCLPTFRKRQSKQFADAHIFHTCEPERAQRVLNGLALRVEDTGF